VGHGCTFNKLAEYFIMEKKPTLLVIDDNPVNIDIIQTGLSADGYKVIAAEDGLKGLDLIRNGDPDIVILDLMMPQPDGFEILKQVRTNEHYDGLPIIVITALQDQDTRIKALKLGADDFINKPFNRIELEARVRSLLRIHNLWEKVQERNEQLIKLDKLKRDLVDMLIHDLNNSTTVIGLNLHLLENYVVESDESSYLLHLIKHSNDETIELLMSLLDTSRLEEGKLPLKLSKIQPRELVDSVVEMFDLAAQESGKKLIKEYSDVPTIIADKLLTKRTLVNLLMNALKYSPRKGKIIIRVSLTEDKKYVRFEVIDDGPGVPSDFKEHIFERFSQADAMAKGKRRGVGLGLTFCKLAVTGMGGTIGFESPEDIGSIFYFNLPVT
jgi:two-component system, sensor histidine kinase and response regulator